MEWSKGDWIILSNVSLILVNTLFSESISSVSSSVGRSSSLSDTPSLIHARELAMNVSSGYRITPKHSTDMTKLVELIYIFFVRPLQELHHSPIVIGDLLGFLARALIQRSTKHKEIS